ncbi:IS4 family transposase [Paraflavitalea speifideaquila]|uniref:IS4 family transposase n=1 Tax=Paraflavitalea speifideaquila TaxID=3076558 RepID=UPI0028E64C0F|nr:IS4 family transposase [Paraflavitalea speifideiaquila]
MDYRGCLNDPTPLIDFRENCIDDVIQTIEDEKFVERSRSKDGGNGFSRKRKLHFIDLITLLTQGLSRSIQRELNSFYQKIKSKDFSIQHVTKGAFSQARVKLKPEAFIELNQVGIRSFYKNAPYLTWRGWRLLSIDGSTIVLPKHKTVTEEFGITNFGPQASSPQSVARISMLYDVLNFTTLDACIDRYDVPETKLARKHLGQVESGKDLLIMDRGYPSLALLFELKMKGIDYCIRMRDDWWLEVRKMLHEGEKDKEVTFKLPANHNDLLSQYNTNDREIRCRLVVIELPDGSREVLCTSVLDNQKLPYENFGELYNYRWNIEEGYKLYKCRLQFESFSGKTAIAVKQDFYAKVFMMSMMAVLAFPLEEKLKQEQAQGRRKHPHKINRTNALAMVRKLPINYSLKR